MRRVRYATMKGVDMAVVELDATYGDFTAAGIQPLVVASPHIVGDLPIELVHIPQTGVATEDQFLRLSTCQAGEPVRLFEGPRFLDTGIAYGLCGRVGRQLWLAGVA